MWLREVVIWLVVSGDGHRGGNRVRVLWVGGGQGGGWYTVFLVPTLYVYR